MHPHEDDFYSHSVIRGMINALVIEAVVMGLIVAIVWNVWALV